VFATPVTRRRYGMLIGLTKLHMARSVGARLNEFGFIQSGTTRLATEEEEREAKAGERERKEAAKVWACDHCSIHLGIKKTECLAVVKEHLRDT